MIWNGCRVKGGGDEWKGVNPFIIPYFLGKRRDYGWCSSFEELKTVNKILMSACIHQCNDCLLY